jgi:hypothetical protein
MTRAASSGGVVRMRDSSAEAAPPGMSTPGWGRDVQGLGSRFGSHSALSSRVLLRGIVCGARPPEMFDDMAFDAASGVLPQPMVPRRFGAWHAKGRGSNFSRNRPWPGPAGWHNQQRDSGAGLEPALAPTDSGSRRLRRPRRGRPPHRCDRPPRPTPTLSHRYSSFFQSTPDGAACTAAERATARPRQDDAPVTERAPTEISHSCRTLAPKEAATRRANGPKTLNGPSV